MRKPHPLFHSDSPTRRVTPIDPDRDSRIMRRLSAAALILSALLAVLMLAFPAGAAPKFPALAGRVTDAANILPAETEVSLNTRLQALEATTKTQLVVATVSDLQGYEIEEYGYQLGRAWGIGQKGTNNGALLIVAPNERKVRIEVGYGLEGVLTDAVTSQIIRRNIIPYFKAGDMAGGVNAGADALIKLLELPPEERIKVAQAAALDSSSSGGGGRVPGFGFIVWALIILLWIYLAISRRKRGLAAGPTVVWGPGMGGWGGNDRDRGGWGGGGGFGGGGFGGGGFGGGGGSFGGGGSSGSW